MKNIICIDTGGTFNKIYDKKKGILDVDKDSNATKHIFEKWLGKFELISIIGKDSLDFTKNDRELLLETIRSTPITSSIIVIHGTDTMDISATYVSDADLPQTIIFTGAMTPFSIEPIEATANLASAIGFGASQHENGVFIAINGLFGKYTDIKKDKERACFMQIK
ncbi:MAG: asparaginase domain-containing protein [Sulfurovaceae bacterium]